MDIIQMKSSRGVILPGSVISRHHAEDHLSDVCEHVRKDRREAEKTTASLGFFCCPKSVSESSLPSVFHAVSDLFTGSSRDVRHPVRRLVYAVQTVFHSIKNSGTIDSGGVGYQAQKKTRSRVYFAPFFSTLPREFLDGKF